MRKYIILCLGVILLTFLGCQKGRDETPQNPLLVKTVCESVYDSIVTNYTYDMDRRLIRENTYGFTRVVGGIFPIDLQIKRNTNGIILSSILKTPVVSLRMDSLLTEYNYNSVTTKYIYALSKLSPVSPAVDSIAYIYDSNNRIVTVLWYDMTSGSPLLSQRDFYNYLGGDNNIIKAVSEQAATPGGALSVAIVYEFTFDNKLSPLVLFNEAVILNRAGLAKDTWGWLINMGNLCGRSNILKSVYTDFSTPVAKTTDYNYWYNAFNMPDSSSIRIVPGGPPIKRTYFYN